MHFNWPQMYKGKIVEKYITELPPDDNWSKRTFVHWRISSFVDFFNECNLFQQLEIADYAEPEIEECGCKIKQC